MLGTKLYKDNQSNMDKYSDVAVWCNANNATIEDKGDYYEVVEITPYTPTKEEQAAQLDTEYAKNKQELMQYYFEFSIAGDTEGMASIKQELSDLTAQYDADLAEIEGGE